MGAHDRVATTDVPLDRPRREELCERILTTNVALGVQRVDYESESLHDMINIPLRFNLKLHN
jgi:hypothetical protein